MWLPGPYHQRASPRAFVFGAGIQQRHMETAQAGGKKNRNIRLREQRTQFEASCLSPVETVLAANENNARKRFHSTG